MSICIQCSKSTNNPKFCSKSCAAKHNNRGINRHGTPKKFCKNCQTQLKLSRSVYCSMTCQHEYQSNNIKESIESEKLSSWRQIRRYLIENNGRCFSCGISEWNGLPISLECDHIDGDITNNRLSNARLLCPNCHSQTPTFKSKNKSNPKGKLKRRERYEKQIKESGAPGGTRTPIFNSNYD